LSGGTGARRRAHGHHGIGHVVYHGGAAAYGAVPPYMDKMIDVGAYAHPASLADVHAAAQPRIGAYMRKFADDAVVFYGAAGIQDHARAYAGAYVHHRPCEYRAARAQLHVPADDRGRVRHADQWSARGQQALLQLGTNLVVAYAHDHALVFLQSFNQHRGIADHWPRARAGARAGPKVVIENDV